MSRLNHIRDLVNESRILNRSIGESTDTVSERGAFRTHVFLTGLTVLAFQTGGAEIAETDGIANVDVGHILTLELDSANDLVADDLTLNHGGVHGIGKADTAAQDRHGDFGNDGRKERTLKGEG